MDVYPPLLGLIGFEPATFVFSVQTTRPPRLPGSIVVLVRIVLCITLEKAIIPTVIILGVFLPRIFNGLHVSELLGV